MRVTVKLTEMEKAEAQYVSLVSRGANRIPFRIVKSAEDNNMSLDLTSIRNVFKGEKAQPAAPTISAVVLSAEVQKSDKFDLAKAALVEAGFSVEKAEVQEDGSVVFAQDDNPLEDGTLVRMDQNLIVVAKGFSCYNENLKGFAEIVGAEGYYDGVRTATSALQTAMSQALRDSGNPAEAVQKTDAVLNDFKAYVATMVKNLPEAAFKAESLVMAACDGMVCKESQEAVETPVEKAACPEGMEQAAWDAMSEEDRAAHLVAKSESAPVETSTGEDDASDEEKLVRKTADVVLSVLKGELAAISGPMAELTTQLAAISESNAALALRVEQVAGVATETAQKADKIQNVVSTTVNAVAAKGDTPAGNEPAKKADTDPRSGCFDTAFLSRH